MSAARDARTSRLHEGRGECGSQGDDEGVENFHGWGGWVVISVYTLVAVRIVQKRVFSVTQNVQKTALVAAWHEKTLRLRTDVTMSPPHHSIFGLGRIIHVCGNHSERNSRATMFTSKLFLTALTANILLRASNTSAFMSMPSGSGAGKSGLVPTSQQHRCVSCVVCVVVRAL